MFEQDDVTPTGEIEKLIKTLRNYFIEGRYKECCGIGITFLSGLSVGLKLKEKEKMKESICNKCSSCGYCMNRENGMMACINFNKFPKATGSYEDYCKSKRNEK